MEKQKRITISIEKNSNLLQEIDNLRGQCPRSFFIMSILEYFMQNKESTHAIIQSAIINKANRIVGQQVTSN